MGSVGEAILDDIFGDHQVTRRFDRLDDIIIFVIHVYQCLGEGRLSAAWRSGDQDTFGLIPQEIEYFRIQFVIFHGQ